MEEDDKGATSSQGEAARSNEEPYPPIEEVDIHFQSMHRPLPLHGLELDETLKAFLSRCETMEPMPTFVWRSFLWYFTVFISAALSPGQRERVEVPPGYRVGLLLRFIYPKKTFDAIFLQLLNDLNLEYIEALYQNHVWHARWIVVRGHLSLIVASVQHLVSIVGTKIFGLFKQSLE